MYSDIRIRFLTALVALAAGLASQAAHAQQGAHAHGAADEAAHTRHGAVTVPLYPDLGTHHYEISTDVPMAQRYFDQGLRLYYAFNHAESIRAFEQAATLDSTCAICHWGIALAYGPNINMPMDATSGLAAYRAVQHALALKAHASASERALIGALVVRYSADPMADRAALDLAYARAMAAVARQYPDDVDVRTLQAEALMDLSPWAYWNRDGSPREHTRELVDLLEGVLAGAPAHPGANHLYIHAVEAVAPERALPMAERLAALMPGAGHIVHMPGHIYIRVGRYEDAIRANEHAVHADESYIREQSPAAGIYTLGYYPHNYDFLAFAASMLGRSHQAIDAAETMASLIPEEMGAAPGMTLLQNISMRRLQLRVRFGRWDEILATPAPADGLPHALGVWHYARGRAFIARGDTESAATELEALRRAATDPSLADSRVEFNLSPDVLGIAVHVLAAHLSESRGETDRAIAQLEAAVRAEDDLVYGEPPEWTVPVRQELGALLLRADRAAKAEAVYREDLHRFPDNVWSLNGLARSLTEQGRIAQTEADAIRHRLDEIDARRTARR